VVTAWERYAATWGGLHGGVDPRRASSPVRAWLRLSYVLAAPLARLGVPPGAVTLAGLALSLLVPVAAVTAGAAPAAALVLLAATADALDGGVAIIAARVSRLGHVYDSVADRLAEAAWLVAFWLLGAPGWLVVAAGMVSWLHEYVRARATMAGMAGIGTVTVAERPTRVIIGTLGLAFAGLGALASPALVRGTVTLAMAAWLLLGGIGLVQLLIAVHGALSGRSPGTPAPVPPPPTGRPE